jgi:putative FmdB family regulatory protein
MPIYEYQCRACGHAFETMQRVSEGPLEDCPACGQPELAKLVSAAGFRLKGGGWYETDFKGGNEKKRNLVGNGGEPKSTESAPSGEKSSSKTEKPATAPAEKSSGTSS